MAFTRVPKSGSYVVVRVRYPGSRGFPSHLPTDVFIGIIVRQLSLTGRLDSAPFRAVANRKFLLRCVVQEEGEREAQWVGGQRVMAVHTEVDDVVVISKEEYARRRIVEAL